MSNLAKAAILLVVLATLTMFSSTVLSESHSSLIVTDSGLGDTYQAGDTATGYLVVQNNGSAIVHDVTVTVTIYPDALLGLPAGYKVQTFHVDLAPGDSKRLEYSQAIPSSLIGFSTAGHYRIDAKVEANGGYVTTVEKSVDIV